MELYLVINLTLVVTGLLNGHQCLQLGILVLLPFIPGSKYWLPADEGVRKFTGTDRNRLNYRNGPERTRLKLIFCNIYIKNPIIL